MCPPQRAGRPLLSHCAWCQHREPLDPVPNSCLDSAATSVAAPLPTAMPRALGNPSGGGECRELPTPILPFAVTHLGRGHYFLRRPLLPPECPSPPAAASFLSQAQSSLFSGNMLVDDPGGTAGHHPLWLPPPKQKLLHANQRWCLVPAQGQGPVYGLSGCCASAASALLWAGPVWVLEWEKLPGVWRAMAPGGLRGWQPGK